MNNIPIPEQHIESLKQLREYTLKNPIEYKNIEISQSEDISWLKSIWDEPEKYYKPIEYDTYTINGPIEKLNELVTNIKEEVLAKKLIHKIEIHEFMDKSRLFVFLKQPFEALNSLENLESNKGSICPQFDLIIK